MKETAPTEALGCILVGGQEAKTEILATIGNTSNRGGDMSGSAVVVARLASVLAVIALAVIDVQGAVPVSLGPTQQEKPAPKDREASKEEKEASTVITGILLDEKGAPVKAHVVNLFMVVEGFARDAFGAPLKGAFTVGPNKQILDFSLFSVKSETDATGRFSLELPKFLFVPSGLRLTGYTIVSVAKQGSEVRVLSIDGKMVTIVPKPDSKKMELGKLSLSPRLVEEK